MTALETKARRAYELGRWRRALVASLPTLLLAGIAAFTSPRLVSVAIAGGLLYAASALFFWRGQQLGRGVLPGILAGVVPFGLMTAARHYGHVCGGAACYSVCIPISAAGGLVAGVVVGRFAARSGAPAAAWLSAGLAAALTGALACACVGVGGLAGMVVGLALGSAPLALRPALRRA